MPLGRQSSPAPRLSLGASATVAQTIWPESYDLQMGKLLIMAATHPGCLSLPALQSSAGKTRIRSDVAQGLKPGKWRFGDRRKSGAQSRITIITRQMEE